MRRRGWDTEGEFCQREVCLHVNGKRELKGKIQKIHDRKGNNDLNGQDEI